MNWRKAGVWSRADFFDIGAPHAVEKTLQRLTSRGGIRRPYRGLYDKPGISKLTGKMVFPPRTYIGYPPRLPRLELRVSAIYRPITRQAHRHR